MDTSHSEHAHTAVGTSLFPEREWKEFRREDLMAGKMVGGLMGSIFLLGIVIYSIVLYSCL